MGMNLQLEEVKLTLLKKVEEVKFHLMMVVEVTKALILNLEVVGVILMLVVVEVNQKMVGEVKNLMLAVEVIWMD